MRHLAAFLGLVLSASFALPVQELLAGCPGGGGSPPPPVRRDGSGDSSRSWEDWWEANRELFFALPRKPFKEQGAGKTEGSKEAGYGDSVKKQAIEALVKALKDADRNVRLQAVIALGKIGGASETKHVLDALDNDKAREVRITAVLAVGLLKDGTVGPRLVKLLEDAKGDEIGRTYAAISLGFIGDKKSLPLLVRVATRPDTDGVRLGALQGLAMIQDTKAAEALGGVLADAGQHKLIRSMAAYALGRQESKAALPQFAKALALKRDDPLVTQAIALALGNLSGEAVTRALREFVTKAKDDYTRAFALLSLARQKDKAETRFLIEGLKEAPFPIRGFVALALGIQGDPQAAAELKTFVKENKSNPSYHAAGSLALGLLKDKEFAKELAKTARRTTNVAYVPYYLTSVALAGDRSVVEDVLAVYKERPKEGGIRGMGTIALLMLGSNAPIEILPKDMQTGGTFERRASASAAGETARREMVAPLVLQVTSGDDKNVRVSAVTSLGNLLDKSLDHGTVRSLAFSYNYRMTPLNRSLWHVFAIP